MHRRKFLASAGLALAGSRLQSALAQSNDPAPALLTIDLSGAGPTIPADFTGLSYESAQLANPRFFALENHALIDLFRQLSRTGVLRLGGGSSEFTTFSGPDPTAPPPFETFGPDNSKLVKQGTVTSGLALRNLRAFLDATGWSCLYGLNLGQGTRENAVAEAVAVRRSLGPRLLAFQIGNEPDSFRNRYRPGTYTPQDFLVEWTGFHRAILEAVPGAKFSGPDISNKLPYFLAFADEARKFPDVVLLTAHYYAMGPAGSPNSTLEHLLVPEPKLETLSDEKLSSVLNAAQASKLPFRISEGSSCWDGGKPGVSDTVASALWCAGYMLHVASRGVAGVNLHGGGNGIYTPIAGAASSGFVRRPEFFGIQFAQQLAGATFVPSKIADAPASLSAHVLRRDGKLVLAVINASDDLTTLKLPANTTPKPQAVLLTGPSLQSTAAPSLATVAVSASSPLTIQPRSATLFNL